MRIIIESVISKMTRFSSPVLQKLLFITFVHYSARVLVKGKLITILDNTTGLTNNKCSNGRK